MNDNSLWCALYRQGYAERVHRLGFSGLSSAECGRLGRFFSGSGQAQRGEKVEVLEIASEALSLVNLKKEHMRERARTLNEPQNSYSLTGDPLVPQTLWESRRREMRRWYRIVTTDPFARVWSVEFADCYVGDIDLYGLNQGLNRFFFYIGATELRSREFITHVIDIWLKSIPFTKWHIETITTSIFIHDKVLLDALDSLGFFELGKSRLGKSLVSILAYKILNS